MRGPLRRKVGPVSQDGMKVVGHDAKPQNIDRHDRSEECESLLQPELAMFIGPLGPVIPAAQKRPADTAIEAVIDPHFVRLKHELPGQSRHGDTRAGAATEARKRAIETVRMNTI